MDGRSITLNDAGADTDAGNIDLAAPATLTLATAQRSRAPPGSAAQGRRRSGGASTIAGGGVLSPGALNIAGGTLTLDDRAGHDHAEGQAQRRGLHGVRDRRSPTSTPTAGP